MRTLYREKIYQCGDYLEVNIYPAYKKSYQRSRKAKPTPEVKKKLNDMYAENKLIRIGNANFTEQDLKVELTYRNECHPEDDESAARELRNFLRRMKNYRKRNSLSELKYIAVTEKGRLKGRYHHHLIISGGISPNALVELWGKGYIHFEPLQFSETGIADLVRYMIKQSSVSSRKNGMPPKISFTHLQRSVTDGFQDGMLPSLLRT